MSALDFLFEGSPPPNVNAATVTQSNMPDWYQEYTRGLLGRSNAIAAQDYSPFPGQRVADFSQPQQQAFDLTKQNIGVQNPAFGTAQNTLNNLTSGFNANQFNQYLNPYVNDVNNTIATLGARNLTENLLPGVNDTFVGAGQFGGSRNAEFTNRALRDTNQAILQQQSANMNQGFQNAMQNYLQGQGVAGSAAQGLGALGQAQQAGALKDAAALEAIGQEQQGLEQKNLDIGYQNFMDQRNWPIQMAQFMNQQIRGFNPPTQQTAFSNAPGSTFQPSPLAQLASAGAVYNAFNQPTKIGQ